MDCETRPLPLPKVLLHGDIELFNLLLRVRCIRQVSENSVRACLTTYYELMFNLSYTSDRRMSAIPGGGTLIFSYIRRLGPFFGGQIFEFL